MSDHDDLLAPPSDADRPVVRLSGPGDLVSTVPYLVGFTPERSLVVISLRPPRLRCGLVARFDLPDPADVTVFVEQVVAYVRQDRPARVALLVYDDESWRPTGRPWQALVDALHGGFEDAGAPVKEAVYVAPERYWSYTCTDGRCCPDGGVPVDDVRASEAAAAFVVTGRAPVRDRAELVRRVAARGPLTTAAVGAAALRELERRLPMGGGPRAEAAVEAWLEDVVDLFGELMVRRTQGGPPVTVDEAGALLAGLVEVPIRDAVALRWSGWLWALPGDCDGDTDGAVPESATTVDDPATSLLLELATMCDGEWALAPLALLAAQLWAAGEGALANAAVERALDIDAEYRMASLVGRLLQAGIPPRWVRRQQEQGGSRDHGGEDGETPRLVS